MKVTLFAKAIRLQQFLKETGITRNKLHFRFEFEKDPADDITTWIEIDNGKTVLSCNCDCKHSSIHFDALCSHKISVILYMLKKQFRIMYGKDWAKHLYTSLPQKEVGS